MASSSAPSDRPDLSAPAGDSTNDPFVSARSTASAHLRFSDFEQELRATSSASEPRQAKRTLEARLAETDRRLDEAAKLGTALVSQRKTLADQLQEINSLQTEEELAPELRKRLVDIEKDYNDLARESARVFLPKQRVTSNENPGSPYILDGRSGRVRSNSIPVPPFFPFQFMIRLITGSTAIMYILHHFTHISSSLILHIYLTRTTPSQRFSSFNC